MLPIRQALTSAPPTGGICGRVLPAVGTFLIGSALHRVNATARQRSENCDASPRSRRNAGSPPVSKFKRASSSPRLLSSTTMGCFAPSHCAHPFGAACGRLCPLRSHSPGKGTLLCRPAAAFTSRGIPDAFGVLCHLGAPCRRCLRLSPLRSGSMGFLFIGSRLSPSLPSPGWLPFPSWLQMMVSTFSCSGISTGDLNPVYNVPMLGTHKARMPSPTTLRVD